MTVMDGKTGYLTHDVYASNRSFDERLQRLIELRYAYRERVLRLFGLIVDKADKL